MPGPSLMALSRLLTDAPQGDPIARAALPAAKQQFMQEEKMSVGPGSAPPQAQPIMPGLAQNPFGMPPPPVPEEVTAYAEDEETQRPGFFQSPQFKNIADLGLRGLGGALGGAIGGDWKQGVIGATQPTIKQLQDQQVEMLGRKHKAWENAYTEAMSLPPEVYNTPGMEALVKAQEALRKDLQDNGQIDNERTLTEWYKTKAMYADDLENLKLQTKIDQEQKVKAAQAQETQRLFQERAVTLNQMLADTSIPESEKEAIRAELATMTEKLDEKRQAEQSLAAQEAHYKAQEANARAGLGLQQQGLNLQERRLDQAGELARAGMGFRNDQANRATFVRNFKDELNLRAREGLANQKDMNEVFGEMAVANRPQIIQLANIKDGPPGSIIMGGKQIPLANLLGQRPELWDAGGTPSEEGWKIVLSYAMRNIMNQPTELRLTDIAQE